MSASSSRRSRPIASGSQEQYELAERDRTKLEGKLAQISVDFQEAQQARMLGRERAQRRAGCARQGRGRPPSSAAEEALNAGKARDQASTGGDDARRELDKLRRKRRRLREGGLGGCAGRRHRGAGARARGGGAQAARRRSERADAAESARRSRCRPRSTPPRPTPPRRGPRPRGPRRARCAGQQAESIVEAAGSSVDSVELQHTAKEVYEAINDILSEMRNNMKLVQGELPNIKSDSSDTIAGGHRRRRRAGRQRRDREGRAAQPARSGRQA